MKNDSIWVWTPDKGATQRLARVLFRLNLKLDSPIVTGLLFLSARTQYRIKVNGVILGGGPARSYPEYREADTVDLKPHLLPGSNQVEVEVLNQATATFHHLPMPPGFIAWGEVIETSGASHSLSTPGNWQCRRRAGVEKNAPPLSFAQGATEAVNLLADAESAESSWTPPVAGATGETPGLALREIPALTRLPKAAMEIRYAEIQETETLVGAWVGNKNTDSTSVQMAAASTWIHSPCDQTVRMGSWWGDYWINGVLLDKTNDLSRPLRQSMDAPLNAGWNRLCAIGSIIFGYWEFCLAWPTDSGLSLSPTRETGSSASIRLAGPVPASTMDSCRQAIIDGTPVSALTWRDQPLNPQTCPPLRKLAWTRLDTPPTPASFPLGLASGQDTLVTVDMGEITLGPITLDIEAPPGTVVSIAHAEQLDVTGRPDYAKAVTMYNADRFVLPGGRQRLETFSPRGFRYLDVLVSNHREPAILHAVGVVETRYPYTFSGAFECSDPDFNRLWAFGRRTLELCSEDVLTDCPWRERTLYGGDLLAEMAATVALTHDLRLVKRCLEIFLQSLNPATGWLQSMAPIHRSRAPLADYPLLVAIGTAWYLRLSDDVAFARRAWPVFRAMAAATERMRRGDGLYSPPWQAFIDHHRTIVDGPTASFNAAVVGALRAFAETARRVDEHDEADQLDHRAAQLEALLPDAFFDTGSGYFRDLPLREGGAETEGSPAIVWPLLFAPATRALAAQALPALRTILDSFTPDQEAKSVSPYQMFYLLALLRELGEAELAENTIRRVYALMLQTPTGTLWEQARPNKSLTHAWSCAVNDYFATAVLGVRLGFEAGDELKTVRISPCAASLKWAKGRVPHPLGDIAVEWRRTGNHLAVTVDAPPGVPVEITPAGPLAALQLIGPASESHRHGGNASRPGPALVVHQLEHRIGRSQIGDREPLHQKPVRKRRVKVKA